ncbi:MAG TPA: hemerythrin domain-containing protein [Candidatus Kapabacteria bacterium]|nr:hemerythrin domain-containing protein [Candidatus Kapabacteria bacterium]
MIRHRTLVPLSHDHHLGLVAAQRLKRGDAAYRDMSVADSIAELWKSELATHFEQEERALFVLEVSSECRAMIERALADHARMRELVAQAARGDDPDATARELGALLEQHIRFEERELFELMQTELGDGLDAIADRIPSRMSCRS